MKSRKKAAKAAKATTPAKAKMDVSPGHVAYSRQRGTRAADPARINPFQLPAHPKTATPAAGMAMDDASFGMSWAASQISQMAGEGLAFLGYPILAELAQRPEYRRMSEVIARHMTRKWIKLKSKGENEGLGDKLGAIEEQMRKLGVTEAFREAAEQDGFFGRGHIFIDFGNLDPEELKVDVGNGRNSVSRTKVSKTIPIRRLKTVEAVWCYPTGYNTNDPLRSDWYRPAAWFVQGKEVHASRLLTFIGREVPDLLKPAYSFGGLPLSQMARPYVDNWIRTRQSVADIVNAFSVFVLKTNLADKLAAGMGEDGIIRRLELFNNFRDNRGVFAIDKELEEFENVSATLSTLDQLQAQTQEHMAAVSGIPIVELLGISPAGLNASSEGEIRTFFDWIHSNQETLFRKPLETVLGFIQLSLYGAVDPDITFDFEPLWSLSEKEAAEMQKTQAETHALLVDSAIISVPEARECLANDPDSPYASLDLDPDAIPVPPVDEDPLGLGAPPGPGAPALPVPGAPPIPKPAVPAVPKPMIPKAPPDAQPPRV